MSRSTPGSTGSPAASRRRCSSQEQARLHPVPTSPHSVALGVTLTVPARMPTVSYDGGMYSVPSELLGQTVWVRV